MVSFYIPSESQLEKLNKLSNSLNETSKDVLLGNYIKNNQLFIKVNKNDVLDVLEKLKTHYCFQQLIDIAGVDYPERAERFEVVYHLLDLINNLRIIVKTTVKENDYIDSCNKLFANSDWLEREVWDMYGIYFKDHNDLRRLLTDFGFEGHPLRKDFPLTGFSEVCFDESVKKVVYKPVKLDVAYRDFSTENPWMNEEVLEEWQHNQQMEKQEEKG